MTRKSWPWDYYNIDENDSKKGACKYCNKSYSGAHVDRMLVHLQSQCTEIPNADKNEILSKIAADEKRRATDGNINSINEKSQEPQNTTTLTLRQQEIAGAKSICKDDGKAFSSPESSEGSTKRNAQTKENLQKNQGEEAENPKIAKALEFGKINGKRLRRLKKKSRSSKNARRRIASEKFNRIQARRESSLPMMVNIADLEADLSKHQPIEIAPNKIRFGHGESIWDFYSEVNSDEQLDDIRDENHLYYYDHNVGGSITYRCNFSNKTKCKFRMLLHRHQNGSNKLYVRGQHNHKIIPNRNKDSSLRKKLKRRITVLGGRRMKTESQGSPTKEGSPIPSSSKANTENESASGVNEIEGDSIQKNVTEKKAIHHASTSKKKCQRQAFLIPRLPSNTSQSIPTWRLVFNSVSEKQLAAICQKNRLVKKLITCNMHFYSLEAETKPNGNACKFRLMVRSNDKQNTFAVYTNDPNFQAPEFVNGNQNVPEAIITDKAQGGRKRAHEDGTQDLLASHHQLAKISRLSVATDHNITFDDSRMDIEAKMKLTSTNAVHKGEQFLKRSPQQLIDQHGDEDEVFACFMMMNIRRFGQTELKERVKTRLMEFLTDIRYNGLHEEGAAHQ